MSYKTVEVGFRIWKVAFKLILNGALMAFFPDRVHAAQNVTLNWDPSSAANVAGYKIYYGTMSRSYTQVMTVGNVTSTTISALVAGQTYYYAATTVDSAGHESAFSNEASYVASLPAARLTAGTKTAGAYGFTVSGAAGQAYVVQASSNLTDWVCLETNTAPFVFVDAQAVGFSRRFYRTFEYAP
jgi:fibronectin type 3 domain-containing protein